MYKGDKTLVRTRHGLPLIAKKTVCVKSVSWTKSDIFFSNIGNISLSRFLVSYDKASLEEVADELISSSSRCFSSSACLISSWVSSGSILKEEFFKSSISYVSSLASCMLEFLLANKASWSDKFLWAFFTFRTWSSIMDKGDKTLERTGDELPLIAKKTLYNESMSWTKSAIFFSNIGNTSLSWFLVSSDKASLEEVADELISSSSRYSSRLKE